MAIDEALFLVAERGATLPTFRVYGWESPVVSLGRLQPVEEAVALDYLRREGIDVVRRPTGGKAVYHDDDVTYAVIAGTCGGLFPDRIVDTYAIISRCLAEGLHTLGAPVTFGPRTQEKESDACCFSSCAPAELCLDGRKLLGSAQVRSRGHFLQHGSLLVASHLEHLYDCFLSRLTTREEAMVQLRAHIASLSECMSDLVAIHERLDKAWREAFTQMLGVTWEEGELTREEREVASMLLVRKYRPWQQRFLLRAP